jgi:hypothetical protein
VSLAFGSEAHAEDQFGYWTISRTPDPASRTEESVHRASALRIGPPPSTVVVVARGRPSQNATKLRNESRHLHCVPVVCGAELRSRIPLLAARQLHVHDGQHRKHRQREDRRPLQQGDDRDWLSRSRGSAGIPQLCPRCNRLLDRRAPALTRFRSRYEPDESGQRDPIGVKRSAGNPNRHDVEGHEYWFHTHADFRTIYNALRPEE